MGQHCKCQPVIQIEEFLSYPPVVPQVVDDNGDFRQGFCRRLWFRQRCNGWAVFFGKNLEGPYAGSRLRSHFARRRQEFYRWPGFNENVMGEKTGGHDEQNQNRQSGQNFYQDEVGRTPLA